MTSSTTRTLCFAIIVACSPGTGVTHVVAQAGGVQSWSEVKCARYKKAWTDALARRGTQGLG